MLENIFSHRTIEAIGWALLHFIWQGVVIAVLLAIALRLLRKSSANMRYAAACSAMILFGVSAVVTMQAVTPARVIVPVHTEIAEAVDKPPAATVVEEVPGPSKAVTTKPAKIATEVPSLSWKERIVTGAKQRLSHIVFFWTLGVLLLSVWHLGGWAQLQRLRRRMVKPVSDSVQANAKRLAKLIGVRRAVELTESALVQVPTVIGWLKPVILLPASVLTGLSGEQLEAILAHELAHIRRHDYLVNMFQTVIEIVGFYHPAVWWVSHRIRAERENCCDDIAVRVCGDGVVYAKALTAIEELRGSGHRLAIAASGGSLLDRIRRLVGADLRQQNNSAKSPALIAVLLALALLAIPATVAITETTQKTDVRLEVEKEGEKPTLVWGDQVNGLRAAVQLLPEKESYSLGEKIGIRLYVQNVSDQIIQFTTADWRNNYGVSAKDENGKKLLIFHGLYSGGIDVNRKRLLPGQATTLEGGSLGIGEVFDVERDSTGHPIVYGLNCEPGRYFLRFGLRFPNATSSDMPEQADDWRGSLEIPEHTLVVTPAPEVSLRNTLAKFSNERANGQKLLVCLWDVEQEASRHLIRELAKRADEFKKQQTVVLLVHGSQAKAGALREWLDKYNIPFAFEIIEDELEDVLFIQGVKGLPWLVLLNEERLVYASGSEVGAIERKLYNSYEPISYSPSETLDAFLATTFAGEYEEAEKFAHPRSGVKHDIGDMDKFLDRQDVTIAKMYADDWFALATSSKIKSDEGKEYLTFFELVNEMGTWLVNRTDAECSEKTKQDLAELLERHTKMRTISSKNIDVQVEGGKGKPESTEDAADLKTIRFTGVVTNIVKFNPSGNHEPLFVVEDDAHFLLFLQITAVDPPNSHFRHGSVVDFLIHDPVILFKGEQEQAIGKSYHFVFMEEPKWSTREAKRRYTLLSVERKVPNEPPDFQVEGENAWDQAENAARQRHFVMIVVGKNDMTFEGQAVTWEQLPGLLEKVPDPNHTVLTLAVASDETTLAEKNQSVGRVSALQKQFGFEYFSYVGVHPLGSKGEPSHHILEGKLQFDKELPVQLQAGTQKEPGLIKCEWIRFEKSQGLVKAKLHANVLSWPKAKWEFRVLLRDSRDRSLKHNSVLFENSGLAVPEAIMLQEEFEFIFGVENELSDAVGFELRIRELRDSAKMSGSPAKDAAVEVEGAELLGDQSRSVPPGRFALLFDGINDYLEVAPSESLRLESQFTVEMWIRPIFDQKTSETLEEYGVIAKGGYEGGPGRAKAKGFGINVYRTKGDSGYFIDYCTANQSGILTRTYGKYPTD